MSRRAEPSTQHVAVRIAQVLLVALLMLGEVHGQSSVLPDASAAEARLKAAFVCKFGNYVEWPGGEKKADEPFVIGALTSDSVVGELTRAAAGQTVNGRPVVIRKLARGDRLDAVAVVFVGRTHSDTLADVLAATRGRPILTVTESDQAIGDGSIVNFVVVDDRVRFDIALSAAERSNLRISGRLLALARKVIGAPS